MGRTVRETYRLRVRRRRKNQNRVDLILELLKTMLRWSDSNLRDPSELKYGLVALSRSDILLDRYAATNHVLWQCAQGAQQE